MILTSPSLLLEIEPAWGGGLVRFDWIADGAAAPLMRTFDRTASSLETPDPNRLACYPLIPWSGRVSGGGFSIEGHRIDLPLNRAEEAWPIHGSGWQRAWQVADASACEASLTLEETVAAGPSFPVYEVRREDRDGQPVDVMVTVMGRVVSLDTVRLTLRPPGRVRT